MQAASFMVLALALAAPANVAGSGVSPIEKVVQLISDLQKHVLAEGELFQKEYAEFAEWCEDRYRFREQEMKTNGAEIEQLKAAIAEEAATISVLTTKVEDLVASIATDEADLKAATDVRVKEAGDFATSEKDLIATIDTITRAIGVLEKQAAKGGSAMIQLKNAASLTEALTVMVQASMIGTSDATKLTSLLQAADQADDEDPGAPAAAVYEGHGGGIVDTLQDLQEKAEGQLADLRSKETSALHNFELVKQSLEDELKFANKELAAAKKGIAVAGEKKSVAEGELQVTTEELAADVKATNTLKQECSGRARDFEAETNSRSEELKALAEAKKTIIEATSSPAMAQLSFLQMHAAAGRSLTPTVRFVRELARKQGSAALAQLASRLAAAVHSAADPFGKVKGLITELIAKLEAEAGAEASKKAYCDRELSETNVKKAEKTTDIEALTTKVDEAAAQSARLKEEVAALETDLSRLAAQQANLDQMRLKEKAAFEAAVAEQKKALEGVRVALKVLRDYYAKTDAAHAKGEGAASGIIGLLEVVEADASKEIAELEASERQAVSDYEAISKRTELEQVTKGKDIEYKTKEAKSLDQTMAELTADRTGVQTELDAVLEYLSKIEEECTAKAESYEDRKARREAEIVGLKDALQVLESETALVQTRSARRTLRGSRRAAALAAGA